MNTLEVENIFSIFGVGKSILVLCQCNINDFDILFTG